MTIYTIGHSNHSAERFVELLRSAGIERLVDVRSNPASRWVTWANPRDLERLLGRAGIEYRYLGDRLGGRPGGTADDAQDDNDEPAPAMDYAAMRQAESFQGGLEDLLVLAAEKCTAIMCAEENPLACHRHHLVGEALRAQEVRLLHIRRDGRIDTDDDLYTRRFADGSTQLALPL